MAKGKDLQLAEIDRLLQVEIPEALDPVDLRQWAAFCAASVEYVYQEASIPVPSWVCNPAYTLSKRKHFILPHWPTSNGFANAWSERYANKYEHPCLSA